MTTVTTSTVPSQLSLIRTAKSDTWSIRSNPFDKSPTYDGVTVEVGAINLPLGGARPYDHVGEIAETVAGVAPMVTVKTTTTAIDKDIVDVTYHYYGALHVDGVFQVKWTTIMTWAYGNIPLSDLSKMEVKMATLACDALLSSRPQIIKVTGAKICTMMFTTWFRVIGQAPIIPQITVDFRAWFTENKDYEDRIDTYTILEYTNWANKLTHTHSFACPLDYDVPNKPPFWALKRAVRKLRRRFSKTK